MELERLEALKYSDPHLFSLSSRRDFIFIVLIKNTLPDEYIETQTANGYIVKVFSYISVCNLNLFHGVKCPSRGWNFFFSDNGDIRGENEEGFSVCFYCF
jgi:hypothetical protein